ATTSALSRLRRAFTFPAGRPWPPVRGGLATPVAGSLTGLRPASRTLAGGRACTALRRLGDGRRLSDLVQVDLAAVVDVRDLHLDLVADVEVVLDLLDPLAVADLGDVQQAVLAGQQRDERAERGGLDHGAEEPVPHLRHGRIGDRVDLVDRRLGGRAVGGTDVDG